MKKSPCSAGLKWSCLHTHKQVYTHVPSNRDGRGVPLFPPRVGKGVRTPVSSNGVLRGTLVSSKSGCRGVLLFRQRRRQVTPVLSEGRWGTPVPLKGVVGVYPCLHRPPPPMNVQKLRIHRSLKAPLRSCRLFTINE